MIRPALQREVLAQIRLLHQRGLLDDLALAADAEAMHAVLDAQPETEHATCKHCAQPIVRWTATGTWRHISDRMQGCRAASFREGSGWDLSLADNWVAAPERVRVA